MVKRKSAKPPSAAGNGRLSAARTTARRFGGRSVHVSLKIKLKKHVLRVIENASDLKGNDFPPSPPPKRNDLTDVCSTALKHVVNYSHEANSPGSESRVRAVTPQAHVGGRAGPCPGLGGGFRWVSGPGRGHPHELGRPGRQTQGAVCRARSGVRRSAGEASGGRGLLRGLWAGGGRRAASAESGKRSRKRLSRGALACHCPLVGSPASCQGLLFPAVAPPAASGRRGRWG